LDSGFLNKINSKKSNRFEFSFLISLLIKID
jgi:hypothetical protein